MKKIFTFSGDYNPEEQSPIFEAFDQYQSPNWYYRYIYTPREINLSITDRLKQLEDNEVDLFRTDRSVVDLIDHKKLIDLSDFVSESDIYKQMLEVCVRGRKMVCVPDNIDALVLFANKKLTEKLGIDMPNTWNELKESLRTVKKKNPALIPFAIHNLKDFKGWWPYYLLKPFFVQAGLNFSKVDADNFFDQKPVIESIEYLGSLIKEGLLSVLDESKYKSRSELAFAAEKAVFIFQGPWALSTIEYLNPRLVDNIDFSVLKNKEKVALVGGRFFAVPASAANPKAAKLFLKSFFADEGYYSRLINLNKIPGVSTKMKLPSPSGKIKKLIESYGVVEPLLQNDIEHQEKIGDEIGRRLQKYLT